MVLSINSKIMISRLKINNFKSHKDTEISLGNLTVLTGVNGCGKTSLIQALLLLRQSFLKNRLSYGLDLNTPLCSVGIAHDALYALADDSKISFDIDTDAGGAFHFVFDIAKEFGDSFIKKDSYNENAMSQELLGRLSLFNNEFQYVSSLRWGGKSSFPKDTYAVENQRQISLNEGKGELVAHFLDRYGRDDVANYYDEEKDDLSLLQQTIYWEQKISPRVTVDVESGKDNQSYNIVYGFEGEDELTKPIRGLRAENVGFGISYTLPVIVALLSARPGAIVILENPEAHLHPDGQAEMARLMAKVARNGVQVIVETHSDHIINGVQLACKEYVRNSERGLDKSLVRMYFLHNKEKHASQVDTITIKDDGLLENQPKGFFDRMEADAFKLYSI